MSNYYKDKEDRSKVADPGDQINPDYNYNTEYGDGNTPEIDLPSPANVTKEIPYEFPGKNNK